MNIQLLHLFHLVSPALPIGAYAYSQGLEFAIDSAMIEGVDELEDWLISVLNYGVGRLDAPVMLRCYEAWQSKDLSTLEYWNNFSLANRETAELLLEDQQLGMALQRLLGSLDVAQAQQNFSQSPCFALQFALACQYWKIDRSQATQGLLWSWLENQVAAATKIVPLGQTQSQQILHRLLRYIPGIAEHALSLPDEGIGFSLPGLAMSSAKHERQYSRLFRS